MSSMPIEYRKETPDEKKERQDRDMFEDTMMVLLIILIGVLIGVPAVVIWYLQ